MLPISDAEFWLSMIVSIIVGALVDINSMAYMGVVLGSIFGRYFVVRKMD